VGTDTADDAGVYRLSDDLALVQTVDFFPPLVDDPYIFGQIAAANALSDVYAMGGVPKTALNLVGFPDHKLPLDILGLILKGGAERVTRAGAVLIGGHTIRDAEIKYGLAVTGLVHPQHIVTNAGARPGDRLVLTKPLGTGFVTTANKAGACPGDVLDAAVASMIELNAGAAEAMRRVGVHAATDITGFGLAGHAFEMATGSRATLILHLDSLPLLPGVERLVEAKFYTRARKSNSAFIAPGTRFDPRCDPIRREVLMDAQTSGGLLISVAANKLDVLKRELAAQAVPVVAEVGEVAEPEDVSLVVGN
jgi:selenide,water dikinase